MLSNSQRPRSVASASGVDKMRKGPLSWKFHDMSLKDWTGNGTSKSKILPTANMPKLQTETDSMLDTVVENVKVECAGEDETAELVAADTPTSADTFCPKITNIVSLEEMYWQIQSGFKGLLSLTCCDADYAIQYIIITLFYFKLCVGYFAQRLIAVTVHNLYQLVYRNCGELNSFIQHLSVTAVSWLCGMALMFASWFAVSIHHD